MPPPLPDRYRLEVRLSRDADIEHWLGTDASLDRPVLIRLLGPETTLDRRSQFLEAVRSSASINHPHLEQVFTADFVTDGAYAVSEWSGGSTIADRVAAGETIAVDDFLANAAGLASALSDLHAAGIVHGAIDGRAITYSVSHPAKLGGLGRPQQWSTASEDIRALASTLSEGLTGYAGGGPPPSEIVDGVHPEVDRILAAARGGTMTAQALAEDLTAAPSPPRPRNDPPSWSRRLLLAAISLTVLALALIGVGQLLVEGSDGGIAVPVDPRSAPLVPTPNEPTTIVTAATPSVSLFPSDLATIDPFGGNEENDELLSALIDSDPATVWRSERYRDQLSLIKPGLGLGFTVDGTPKLIVIEHITPGLNYQLGWAPRPAFEEFQAIAAGTNPSDRIELQLPERSGGWWILWVTDVPPGEGGERFFEVGEVRFGE